MIYKTKMSIMRENVDFKYLILKNSNYIKQNGCYIKQVAEL